MPNVAKLLLTLGFYLLSIVSVAAIPAWESARGQSSIGSLVPGASYISALGHTRDNEYSTNHLSVYIPGQPGNLTITPNRRAPPLFFLNQNQLWQFNNESAIYPVNVVNVTKTAGHPLQLIIGKKRAGLRGVWRWRGTMLYYDHGLTNNQGLYYSCPIEGGSSGIFIFLKPSKTPDGCDMMTLHSFDRDHLPDRR